MLTMLSCPSGILENPTAFDTRADVPQNDHTITTIRDNDDDNDNEFNEMIMNLNLYSAKTIEEYSKALT